MTRITVKDTATADNDFSDDHQWHRLNPLAVFHILVALLKGLLNQGLNLAPVAILIIATAKDNFNLILTLIAVLGLISIIYSFFAYMCFRFRLAENRVLIRRGVLTTKKLTLRYDRVQSINISEPFYFRPFGLAVLKLDSAGSVGSEVALFGISKLHAKHIRSDVLAYQKNHFENDDVTLVEDQNCHKSSQSPSDRRGLAGGQDLGDAASTTTPAYHRLDVSEEPPATSEGELLVTRSVKDLVKFGLSSNNIWIFAGLLASVIGGNTDKLSFLVTPRMADFLENIQRSGTVGILAAILVALLMIIIILLSVSVLLSIIQHYRFRLIREQDRLIKTSGLLELKHVSLKKSRIQALDLSQNFIAKLMGVRHLLFQKAGNNIYLNLNADDIFLIPSLHIGDQENSLVARLYQTFNPADLSFKTISKKYINKNFMIYFFIPVCLLSLGIFALKENYLIAVAPLTGFLVYPLYALRYRQFGYAMTKDYIAFQSGFIGQSVTYAEIRKAQNVILRRSLYERRNQLATVIIRFAGKVMIMPLMSLQDAQFIADYVLYKVETSPQDWM